MSYIPNTNKYDLFERVKISQSETVLDISHMRGDKNNRVVSELINNGATSVAEASSSSVIMTVSTLNDSVWRQSRRRAVYTPGKMMQVYLTGCLNNKSGGNDMGTTTRMGLFDSDNGLYFQYRDQTFEVVKLSASGGFSQIIVPQNSFNIDKADGSGSCPALDFSKVLLLGIRFQWLGVGAVIYSVFVNGKEYDLHKFTHSNSSTNTYMGRATLPLRYSIQSDATNAQAQMRMICACVSSENGYQPLGLSSSINNFNNSKACPSGAKTPILGIIISSNSYNSINIHINEISAVCENKSNCLIEIWKGLDDNTSVLTGESWTSDGHYQIINYDVSATAIDTTNMERIASSYMSDNVGVLHLKLNSDNSYINYNVNNVSDMIYITGTGLSTTANICCSINYESIV